MWPFPNSSSELLVDTSAPQIGAHREGSCCSVSEPQPSTFRRVLFWLISILILLAVIESFSALFLKFVLGSTAHFLVWNPDIDASKVWAAASGNWDDELGWPSPSDAVSPPRDRTGAKYNPDFAQSEHPCASAYGDSFVWGTDIPLADGWVEQLSRKLGCRVANYAVEMYGTDQSYVRLQRIRQDEAPVTLLGIFPENIMLNVNQYRGFLGYSPSPTGLKGRFVLDGEGRLQWIHRPRIDEKGFLDFLRDPASLLPHEYLLPDTPDGPVTLRFPYTATLARFALMPRLRVRITGRPSWADFYRADHPSGALALTAALVEAFVRESEHRGKRALIVMLPGASSFRARAEFGQPEYAPLIAALTARKIEVFDPTGALLSALGQRSHCELYIVPADCNGHFGIEGSRIVADVVMAELRRRGLVN
jgi:hypothetical protein